MDLESVDHLLTTTRSVPDSTHWNAWRSKRQ